MTKITTDIAGNETTAQMITKLRAVSDFWFGTASTSAATTWGALRVLMNSACTFSTSVSATELGASFVTKRNWLNNPDQVIPATIFSGGRQGVWFDPSDFASMFQDGVGSTPVTAPGQSVGTVLDKSKGLALGVEKVTNGDFSGGTTGWVASTTTASISVVGEALRIQSTVIGVNARYAEQTIAGLTVGKSYRLSAVVVSAGGAGTKQIRIDIRTSNGSSTIAQSQTINSAANTTISMVFVATETTHRVWLRFDPDASGDTTSYVDFDNVSVREIAGNHAFQPTASKRPVLTRRPKTGLRNILPRNQWDAIPIGAMATDYRDRGQYLGGPLSAKGISAEIVGKGVTDGISWVDVRYFGTNTSGANAFRNIGSNITQKIPAGATNVSISHWVQVVAGSLPSGVSPHKFLNGRDASLADVNGPGVPFVPTATWQRYSAADLAVPANMAEATAYGMYVRFDPGVTFDVTFRIGGGQVEYGSTVTALQNAASIYDLTEPGVQDCYGLMFDGVDDVLQTGNIAWGTDEVTVTAGLRKLSDAARGMVAELGPLANQRNFQLNAPSSGLNDYGFLSSGSATAVSTTAVSAPNTSVITGQAKLTTDTLILRRNAAQTGTSAADQGTGSAYDTNPLYIGMRAGTSLPFNGILFGLTAVNAVLDATQLGMVERSTNFNTGGF